MLKTVKGRCWPLTALQGFWNFACNHTGKVCYNCEDNVSAEVEEPRGREDIAIYFNTKRRGFSEIALDLRYDFGCTVALVSNASRPTPIP